MTRCGLQGEEEQQPVIQPLETHYQAKLGSAEARHLGYNNNRGVYIKLGCLGGGGGVALPPPSMIRLSLSGQSNKKASENDAIGVHIGQW